MAEGTPGKGWVTAEYSMLPGSSPERVDREAAKGKQSGRTQEIQRLIGRSLRAVTDFARCPTCRSRSTATCCRPTAALAPRRSAAVGSRCTTRARGSCTRGELKTHPDSRSVRGDLGRCDRRCPDARPRVRRRRARRSRHERRHDRVGPVRRGAGHCRRAWRSRAPTSTRCSISPSRASARSSPRSRRWLPSLLRFGAR